jgi:hypothetical protein
VHVRRADYIGHGWALPFSYYEEAIERALPTSGRLSIVTDDPGDSFFLRFRKWRPRYHQGSFLQDLSYMTHAPRLVMSASTFSWWPAFLGNAEMVICPVPSFGIWASEDQQQGIDLIDRSRFICLDCPMAYHPNAIEKIYQRARSYRHRSARWLNDNLHTQFSVKDF